MVPVILSWLADLTGLQPATVESGLCFLVALLLLRLPRWTISAAGRLTAPRPKPEPPAPEPPSEMCAGILAAFQRDGWTIEEPGFVTDGKIYVRADQIGATPTTDHRPVGIWIDREPEAGHQLLTCDARPMLHEGEAKLIYDVARRKTAELLLAGMFIRAFPARAAR